MKVDKPTEAHTIIDIDPDQQEYYDEYLDTPKMKWYACCGWIIFALALSYVAFEYFRGAYGV